MLISHRKKFIYLKTRKTAGSSVMLFLEPFCVDEGSKPPRLSATRPVIESSSGIIGFHDPTSTINYKWWNHMPAKLVKQNAAYEWENYTKVCCIRNPYDKVLSFFWWMNPTFISENLTLEEIRQRFSAWIETDEDMANDRYMYTIDQQLCLDYYIRYESLQDSLGVFCNLVDVPFKKGMLTWERNETRPRGLRYQEIYNQRSADRVRRAYNREFEWFHYSENLKD